MQVLIDDFRGCNGRSDLSPNHLLAVSEFELECPGCREDTLEFSSELRLLFVQVVLPEPLQAAINLTHVFELKELVVELKCADGFVCRQEFQKGSHGSHSPRVGRNGGIGQFVISPQGALQQGLSQFERLSGNCLRLNSNRLEEASSNSNPKNRVPCP